MSKRVILIGGPMRGKSTHARRLAAELGIPCYCTDTRAQDRAPVDGVTYLPEEHRGWSDASKFVAEHWLAQPGPWVLEGVAAARALRKWLDANPGAPPPCDQIIHFADAYPGATLTKGQATMAAGVRTVWGAIKHHFEGITVDGGRLPPDPFRDDQP